jgi:mannosyltransferase OCH1-like enzyme
MIWGYPHDLGNLQRHWKSVSPGWQNVASCDDHAHPMGIHQIAYGLEEFRRYQKENLSKKPT